MMVNPFCYIAEDGEPVLELKMGVVLYVEDPPNPDQARRVYDFYFGQCGDRIRTYCSTAPGSLPQAWDRSARKRFEDFKLKDLRKRRDWGYGFADGRKFDSWLFMFHGYRPYSEAGKASFFRFDFDWGVDLDFLRGFVEGLLSLVPCLSGFGGYYFQGSLSHWEESYNRMFTLGMRYWGIEAHNLDVTVNSMLQGYKSVNWLTIIGETFRQGNPEAVRRAKNVAFAYKETPYAVLFQADAKPRFGDRNRQEVLPGYVALANALLPLQITEHDPLGGTLWTADNTIRYIRRFTHPDQVT